MYPVIRVLYNDNTGSVSYYSGDTLIETRIYIQQILNGPYQKRACMEEIRNRRNFHINRYSKGVLMILKINDPQYYNLLNPDFFTANGEWIIEYTKKTKKQHNLIESQDPSDCVVCLEEYDKNDSFKLSCNCKFSCHKECLEKWLDINQTCPFCKV